MNSLFKTSPPPPASPDQRIAITRRMRRLELPTERTCLMHRPLFQRAGLPEPALDSYMHDLLSKLDMRQASALIAALDKQLEEES